MISIPEAIAVVQAHIADVTAWESIVINKRKPVTYRVFINVGDSRICLHKFEACAAADSFAHPHPWPSRMLVLAGTYEMAVSCSTDLQSKPSIPAISLTLQAGSEYAMLDKVTWHQVIPRTTCYSLMVNGPRWEERHAFAPSTSGKGLDPLPASDLAILLEEFKQLLNPYVA